MKPTHTIRPALERIQKIHVALQQGGKVNCTRLAGELQVSTKTIQRDIDFMCDRWGLPIVYDPMEFSYGYSSPVENFPGNTISEGELVALLVAQKAIEQYRGTPFGAPLANAFHALASRLPQEISVSMGDAQRLISFKPIGIPQAHLHHFQKISSSVLHHREIAFDYEKIMGRGAEPRRLQPYHLTCVQNQWYMIGHDLDRDAIRTFVLTRVSRVNVTTKKFVRPASFSIDAYLKGSFGIFTGNGDHKVVLRFDEFASKFIREKFWHESQTISEKKNGTLELTLQLNTFEEVQRWVLGWADHVEVISPKELRGKIANLARSIAKKNG